ncbi:hypothetical protein WMY93_006239 [Mugilogobius chulae]|uniref:Chemokine interleukin-8-like domain-containing protein n=1 Tax=Mugilogobius chulae TaxID=88201 RepID=A0AAW0PV50_9GOBI
MSAAMRNLCFLLIALAGVCVQIYQAQDIKYRCVCPVPAKFAVNITDFRVIEKRSGCDKTELVVTVATGNNSTAERCLDTTKKFGIAMLKCWDNKGRNETRKHECIRKR